MSQNFLEQESTRANRSAKKQVVGGLILLVGLLALLYVLMKDSFDRNDPSSKQVLVYLGILVGVMPVSYTHLDVYKRQALPPLAWAFISFSRPEKRPRWRLSHCSRSFLRFFLGLWRGCWPTAMTAGF